MAYVAYTGLRVDPPSFLPNSPHPIRVGSAPRFNFRIARDPLAIGGKVQTEAPTSLKGVPGCVQFRDLARNNLNTSGSATLGG